MEISTNFVAFSVYMNCNDEHWRDMPYVLCQFRNSIEANIVTKFTGNFVDFFLPLLSLQFTHQFDGKFHGHCSEKDKNRCTQLYHTRQTEFRLARAAEGIDPWTSETRLWYRGCLFEEVRKAHVWSWVKKRCQNKKDQKFVRNKVVFFKLPPSFFIMQLVEFFFS